MQPRIKVLLASSTIAAASCAGAVPIPEQSISAPKNALVQLDGREVAVEGFRYSWRLLARPEGSEAELTFGQRGLTALLPADRGGVFRAELLGGFGVSSAPLLRVNVVVENSPPEARAQAQSAVMVGGVLTLEGRNSRDPDRDELTYAWSVVARPEGSAAAIVAPDARTAWFTPDVTGYYTFGLVVHDGEVASAPDTVTVEATPRMAILDQVFRGEALVVYSTELDRLAVASPDASRMFVYEVGSRAVFTVGLPDRAVGIALAPDGRRAAAVGRYDLTIIDLQTLGGTTAPLPEGAWDVVFGDDVVYLVSISSPSRRLYSIDVTTGETAWVVDSTSLRRIRRAPGQQALYGLSTGAGVLKWDTSSSPAELQHGVWLGDSITCQRLWVGRDGSRLFVGSGQVYAASADPEEDIAFVGVLPPGPECAFEWIEQPAGGGVILSATAAGVRVHDAGTFVVTDTVESPLATYGSGSSVRTEPTSPKAVFVGSDGATLVILLEVEGSSSSKRYGVYELPGL